MKVSFRHVEEGAIDIDSIFYTLKLNRQDEKKTKHSGNAENSCTS